MEIRTERALEAFRRQCRSRSSSRCCDALYALEPEPKLAGRGLTRNPHPRDAPAALAPAKALPAHCPKASATEQDDDDGWE